MTNQFVTVKRNVKRNVKNIRVYKNTKGMYIMRGGKRVYVQEGTGQENKAEKGWLDQLRNVSGTIAKDVSKSVKRVYVKPVISVAKDVSNSAKHIKRKAQKKRNRFTTSGDLVQRNVLEPLLQNTNAHKTYKIDSERYGLIIDDQKRKRLEKEKKERKRLEKKEELKNKNIAYQRLQGGAGSKRRNRKSVRKHRGVIQTGGNSGRLRKGYKYTGRRLKNGKAEIVRVKRN